MKKIIKYFVISIYLAGFFLLRPAIAFGEGGLPQKVLGQDYRFEKVFYLPKYNAVKGVQSLETNWQKIDILAPQYHTVNANFSITGSFGPMLKKAIKDHNLKVMPLISNANFSHKTMHNLLLSPKAQDKIIDYLARGALTNGYIGWQFDFENISYKDKDLYTAFCQKASKYFKEKNLVFSIAVIARSVDFENTNGFKNWSGVYDYQKLSQTSDFISLMAYDDPQSKGPVSSVEYVNKIQAYVKDKIPAQKLSWGVPLYYWKWNADTNTKIGSGFFSNVAIIVANFTHQSGFDESLGVSWLTYSYNNKNYKVWFEDKQSFGIKMDFIKNNGLRGFSAWLLGGEDPNIWDLFGAKNLAKS